MERDSGFETAAVSARSVETPEGWGLFEEPESSGLRTKR